MRNRQDGTSKRFEQYTVHDVRKAPASRLAEAPFMYSRDLINSMLLHTNGDELDAVYILTKLVQETAEMVQRWNDHVDEIMSPAIGCTLDQGLEPMKPSERKDRLRDFREGWSKRADQVRAEATKTDKPKRRRTR